MYMNYQQIQKVSGEQGARAYPLSAGSSILLLDETDPIVWLKTTDSGGYATIKPFKITPYIPAPTPDLNDILNRLKLIEDKLNESNNTSNVTEHKHSKPVEREEC